MIQRAKGIIPDDWPFPESLMDFDIPEELKYLLDDEGVPTAVPILLHDCG